ncbi:MAG TPA: AAA family ATPase, partial [Lacipirellulaceae bacterium]|nr:AAA family ATPase [Lacipirellulaceae bacterium]
MPRETIITANDLPEPGQPSDSSAELWAKLRDDEIALRPRHMHEMVGQKKVAERLAIAVDAARKRKEPLGHILLDGPPGLGKTTFATCIPRDLGIGLQIASGAALAAPKDLLPYLTNAEGGSVLFIDEIHRLPKAVEEFMYPAMEDFRVDITLGEGAGARTVNMKLRPFTVIGATTRSGLLSAP